MKLNLWPTIFTAILLCGLPTVVAIAAEKSFELTVSAGEHDRTNTPVKVLIEAPAEAKSAVLSAADGTKLTAQLTAPGLLSGSSKTGRELHFVLPELKKGKSIKLTATVSTDAAEPGFAWKATAGEFAELSYAQRPVLRYFCRTFDDSTKQSRHDTYKVFHHLYNPAGTTLVTKGPGGKFTHHRGLFFGFNRIDYGEGRVDTWHCGGDAHQTHEGFLAAEAGPVLGRHQVTVAWHGKGKKVFASERRELTVYNVPGGQLVEFASRLSSTVGKVKLDGDPQHAGFQFRASQKVAAGDQKATYYLRTDGKGAPGETRNWPGGKDTVNRPWNAMSFVIDDQRYTAVYVDHPRNPKEARYSERTYGRFGSYFMYELDEGKDLEVNYRVWLQDGEMTVEQAAALRNDFVEPVEVTVN